MSKDIKVLPGNRVIIRLNVNSVYGTWHMVGVEWLQDQIKFSKNSLFEKALNMIEKEYE